MRIWPVSNRDVFFQFCPIRLKAWKLLPGNQYLLNYRMLVYSGIITPEIAERYWQDYANPPEVIIELIK
jgi:hypothetical protein